MQVSVDLSVLMTQEEWEGCQEDMPQKLRDAGFTPVNIFATVVAPSAPKDTHWLKNMPSAMEPRRKERRCGGSSSMAIPQQPCLPSRRWLLSAYRPPRRGWGVQKSGIPNSRGRPSLYGAQNPPKKFKKSSLEKRVSMLGSATVSAAFTRIFYLLSKDSLA